ncbi:hypothetical protein ACNKHV_20230 [Shigella flexneri]
MERHLFIATAALKSVCGADKSFYVCSLSNLVNIYKGLCMPADLPRFYLNLADLRSGIGHLPVPPALLH